MSFLLDTCVVFELLKPTPNRGLTTWLELQPDPLLFLSVITLAEIQKGIAKLAPGKKSTSLQDWLDHDLLQRFRGRILALEDDVALQWGRLQGQALRAGRSLPILDSLIGATAVVHSLTVITRNERDLEPTGAAVLNPWRES